ncbi:MAG: amidohydrolase family protein [Cyclobacteriaceae bacterium]
MRIILPVFLFISSLFLNAIAQETFPKNGVADERLATYAFTNATIYQDYHTIVEGGTLLIQQDKVLALGTGIPIPKEAIEIDLQGKFIYPSFIDPYTSYGLSNFNSKASASNKPQYDSKRKEAYGWNDYIKSDFDASENVTINKAQVRELTQLGFGAVNTYRALGLVRGTSAFVNLSDKSLNEAILKGKAAAHHSFSGGIIQQSYPNSIMGSVALIRQTYLDADWYQSNSDQEFNLTLEAFNENKQLPQIFEASSDKLRLLLADQVGDEFGVQYIIKGNGDEYQRVEAIKATRASLIIPLKFPKAYNVSDPLDARDVTLAEMKHWEMAPLNAKILSDQAIEFAFTTHGMDNKSDLWTILRTLAKNGLSRSEILKAFTHTPASYFDLENEVGSLKKGMLANFFISSKDAFDAESKILETWVQGQRHQFGDLSESDFAGKYSLSLEDEKINLELIKIPAGHSAVIFREDSTILPVTLAINENNVLITFTRDSSHYRLSGWIGNDRFGGTGVNSDGDNFSWQATKEIKEEETQAADSDIQPTTPLAPEVGDLTYPFVANGWTTKPEQETKLFKNATVWEMTSDLPLEETDVLVKGGKIAKIGKNLDEPGATIIDATGKHLTPGIIDEHSHIALSSVNEGSHAVVSEVRMYDALNSEDVNIYRNLAGGVTSAQLLHGSANPVGGQSALVKFRWGALPTEMKIEDADPFIKFALGENVKQSNWGAQYNIRFPQTRMGVEQVYMDAFTRAREYGEAMSRYQSLSKKEKARTSAPRTNLQLEALLEIINNDRFITCHSYVQSEINMLMKVAERFDFNINTFTHILEGYKIADKMKEHGAGGSTFSDWWAYKFEVNEAIPYNAAIMTNAGLTVAINSDDAEMARRLNQEAAKTVKYGGLTEMEALRTVTLNPAKLLHLDHRVGSITVNKDADLVLWSDHPLSIYARPEYTLVDGIIYYSLEKDQSNRAYITQERTRLINKMITAKAGGAATQQPHKKEENLLHCDSEENGFTQNATSHE